MAKETIEFAPKSKPDLARGETQNSKNSSAALPEANGRRQPRRRVLWISRLHVGPVSVDVRICDIAPGGAKVKVDLPLKEGAEVVLSHQRFGDLDGRVVWQADGSLGLAFNADPDEVIGALGPSAAILGMA